MNVIDIAIAVVVYAIAWDFTCIYPHVCSKVRMCIFYTVIQNRNDDGWVTCSHTPCISDIYVSSGYGLFSVISLASIII